MGYLRKRRKISANRHPTPVTSDYNFCGPAENFKKYYWVQRTRPEFRSTNSKRIFLDYILQCAGLAAILRHIRGRILIIYASIKMAEAPACPAEDEQNLVLHHICEIIFWRAKKVEFPKTIETRKRGRAKKLGMSVWARVKVRERRTRENMTHRAHRERHLPQSPQAL